MGKNPEWFAQQRARGRCHICRQPMPDDDVRLAHAACTRQRKCGLLTADIRWNEDQRACHRPLEAARE